MEKLHEGIFLAYDILFDKFISRTFIYLFES